MLGFFRKYQKFFFVIVTFFIVVSFVFFGTSNTLGFKEEAPNREIGKLVDGRALMEKDLHGLIRMIEHGIEEGGRNFNLLNDSMVHREIVVSGLGEVLADHYFEDVKEELSDRWHRIKNYTPYAHPYAPQISARNVWAQYAPEISALLDEVNEAPMEFSKEQLPLLFKLYQAQAQFPSYYLHQILYYSQEQSEGIRPDPSLPQLNVSLFGYESVEDWFGAEFVNQVGVFLLNASCIAQDEGYQVTKDEAHIDLLSNVYRGLKMMGRDQNMTNDDVQGVILSQVRSIGMTLEEAVDHWRGVMQFKRHFQEVGEAVFLDRLAFDQFKSFAKASHKICRYSLPRSLELRDFKDLMKFQHYIEVVGEENFVNLPARFKSAESVMEEHPQLVYKPYIVEIAQVAAHDVAARVSLKQTWEWEEAHFAKLQEQFSSLSECSGESVEERYAALEGLSELERLRVDQFARNAIVAENPDMIDEALSTASFETETLKVNLVDGEFSGAAFLELLEAGGASKYSPDDQIFYSIHVVEKGEEWQLLSFEEANRNGTLDHMVERLLMTAYESMEIEEPFDEIAVGEKVFTDLLQAIKADSLGEINELDDYAQHRFDGYLEKMLQVAKRDAEAVKKGPWALEEREEYLASETLVLTEGEFSDIEESSFFQLIEREDPTASEAEIAAAKEHLKRDAQKALMRKIISRL